MDAESIVVDWEATVSSEGQKLALALDAPAGAALMGLMLGIKQMFLSGGGGRHEWW